MPGCAPLWEQLAAGCWLLSAQAGLTCTDFQGQALLHGQVQMLLLSNSQVK